MAADLFRCFRQGAAWLLEAWPWTLALVALGTLLSALGPWIQLRAGLPDDPATSTLVAVAAILPFSIYAEPRFHARLDALALNRPENPREGWQAAFESRWTAFFGARTFYWLAVVLGAALLLVPGLMIMAAFGWVSTLVLLRGFDLRRALRGSLRIMAAHGSRVLFVALGAFLVDLLVITFAARALPFPESGPTLHQRLSHPLVWAINALDTLLGLWVGTTLLALFHQVEAPALAPDPPEET